MSLEVNANNGKNFKITYLKKMFLSIMSLWTLAIVMLLVFMFNARNKAIFDIAVRECKTDFDKDVQYRLWATKHGGVYVPQTKETPPNPYLAHVKERDITTPSGKKLTLINPAYMTRQVFELGRARFHFKGHITSIKPIRKENAPDDWEKIVLKTFESGVKEKIEILDYEGEEHIRFMAPFVTEKGCLKCHAAQGYKLGEIRGGISISLPWQPFKNLFWQEMKYDISGYVGIWILGLTGLFVSYSKMKNNYKEKEFLYDELVNNENMLNTLLNGIHESALLIDTRGIVLAANEIVDQRINKGKKDIIGKNVFELLPKEVADNRLKYLATVISTGKPVRFEDARLGKYIDNFLTPIFDEEGNVSKVALIGIDITERKLTEQELVAKNKFIETILENAPIGFAVNQINDGRAMLMSSKFFEIYGINSEEIVTVDDFFEKVYLDVEFRNLMKERIMTDMASGDPSRMQWKDIPITTKTGVKKYITAINIPVLDQNLMVSTVQDTTSRKLAEIELQKSEERFRYISSSITDISYSCISQPNRTSTIDWLYGAVKKITGYTEEEIFAMKCWGKMVLEEDFPIFKKHILDVPVGSSDVCQLRLQKKDGTIVWIQASSQCVEPSDNSPINTIYGGLVDITERKFAEVELKKHRNHLQELVELRTAELDKININLIYEIEKRKEAEQQLEKSLEKEKQLSQLKSRFISTASHEFRTPLTSVLTSTELIQRYRSRWSEEKINEHFERIKNSISNLTKLMDDVLLVNRAESGTEEFSPTNIDLYKLCNNLIDDSKMLIGKSHKIIIKYEPSNRSFLLDRKRIELILANILSNAIKYSPDGGVIELRVAQKNNELQFLISDNGIGIPQEDIPRLFEPFHRSKNTVDIKGTGLGLSIVKHAVELHRGKIEVDSKEGIGTKFTVTIPI